MVVLLTDSGEEELLTDLQRLIVLRVLRPDRMIEAASSFVSRTLEFDPENLPDDGLNQMLKFCCQNLSAFLILLPHSGSGISTASQHLLSNAVQITQTVEDSIRHLAKV